MMKAIIASGLLLDFMATLIPVKGETHGICCLTKPLESRPWFIIGDFNEILSLDEKCGGRPRTESQMEDFKEAKEDNTYFTWGGEVTCLLGATNMKIYDSIRKG